MKTSTTLLLPLLFILPACAGRLDLGHDDDSNDDLQDDDGGAPTTKTTDGGGAKTPTTTTTTTTGVARGRTIAADRFGDEACGILSDGTVSCWGNAQPFSKLSGTFTSIFEGTGALCGVTTAGAIACDNASGLPAANDYVRVAVAEGDFRVCGITSAGDLECGAGNGQPAEEIKGPFVDLSLNNGGACALSASGKPTCETGADLPAAPLATFQLVEAPADGAEDRIANSCGLTTDGTPTCSNGLVSGATSGFTEASFADSADENGDSTSAVYCGIQKGALACATFSGAKIPVPAGTFEHVVVSENLNTPNPFACAVDTAGKVTCFLLDGTAAAPTIGSPDPSLVFSH